jgi:hypothetical protein
VLVEPLVEVETLSPTGFRDVHRLPNQPVGDNRLHLETANFLLRLVFSGLTLTVRDSRSVGWRIRRGLPPASQR